MDDPDALFDYGNVSIFLDEGAEYDLTVTAAGVLLEVRDLGWDALVLDAPSVDARGDWLFLGDPSDDRLLF